MKLKFLIVVAGLACAGAVQANSADFKCHLGVDGPPRCVPTFVLKDRAKRDYEKVVLPILKRFDYPSRIVAETPGDYKIARRGWKVRRNCEKMDKSDYSHDIRLNTAKLIYCDLTKKGYFVPKPEIVKGY